MKSGYLSQYFEGIASKVLSSVEVNPETSNQREFNGTLEMKQIFGSEKATYETKFIYLNDIDDPLTDSGILTWYDARENNPIRSEYRLYFSSNNAMRSAHSGDLLIVGRLPDKSAIVLIAGYGSSFFSQLQWLFNLDPKNKFDVKESLESEREKLFFASKLILEQIGVETDDNADNQLEGLIENFGKKFPSTRDFSEYARKTCKQKYNNVNPDEMIIAWLEHEEALFKSFEKYLIQEKLDNGFEDVDEFIKYSLSVQNRRKSRAGSAFENHFEQILINHRIHYDRTKVTENRAKPDFIFPSIGDYHNIMFPPQGLTMLAVKTTCKDRWRQILIEAKRIQQKHLLTLEPAISQYQTEEMSINNVHLVMPHEIIGTYTVSQQRNKVSIQSFIEMLSLRQKRYFV